MAPELNELEQRKEKLRLRMPGVSEEKLSKIEAKLERQYARSPEERIAFREKRRKDRLKRPPEPPVETPQLRNVTVSDAVVKQTTCANSVCNKLIFFVEKPDGEVVIVSGAQRSKKTPEDKRSIVCRCSTTFTIPTP